MAKFSVVSRIHLVFGDFLETKYLILKLFNYKIILELGSKSTVEHEFMLKLRIRDARPIRCQGYTLLL